MPKLDSFLPLSLSFILFIHFRLRKKLEKRNKSTLFYIKTPWKRNLSPVGDGLVVADKVCRGNRPPAPTEFLIVILYWWDDIGPSSRFSSLTQQWTFFHCFYPTIWIFTHCVVCVSTLKTQNRILNFGVLNSSFDSWVHSSKYRRFYLRVHVFFRCIDFSRCEPMTKRICWHKSDLSDLQI